MNEQSRSIVKTAAIGVGVLVMAFLGVVAGNRYLEWRQVQRMRARVAALPVGESTLLRKGDAFPSVAVRGLDGSVVSTGTWGDQGDYIVLFVSIGCDPCTEAVESWSAKRDELDGSIRVYGLCDEGPAIVRAYVEEAAFPFPMYCDTAHVMSEDYMMDVYPSVVGVSAGGTIAFVRHGITADFTPGTAQRLVHEAGGGHP